MNILVIISLIGFSFLYFIMRVLISESRDNKIFPIIFPPLDFVEFKKLIKNETDNFYKILFKFILYGQFICLLFVAIYAIFDILTRL